MDAKELIDKILVILEILSEFTDAKIDDTLVDLLRSLSNNSRFIDLVEKWLGNPLEQERVCAAFATTDEQSYDVNELTSLLCSLERIYNKCN